MKLRELGISREEVEKALEGVDLHEKQASYFVVVNGREFPVKRAMERVLNSGGLSVTVLDFTTADAVRFFRNLRGMYFTERR